MRRRWPGFLLICRRLLPALPPLSSLAHFLPACSCSSGFSSLCSSCSPVTAPAPASGVEGLWRGHLTSSKGIWSKRLFAPSGIVTTKPLMFLVKDTCGSSEEEVEERDREEDGGGRGGREREEKREVKRRGGTWREGRERVVQLACCSSFHIPSSHIPPFYILSLYS